MDDALRERLLNSIENDRLVLFCGAGLSMAGPSQVPSALGLARLCGERYQMEIGAALPGAAATDLESQAEYFFERDELVQTFIQHLIPRQPFRSPPNAGHFAIADFLSCNVVDFVLSTNVDRLIEVAAEDLGEDQAYVALNGDEANTVRPHSPHIKLHGCLQRDEANTIWCHSQLNTRPIATRLDQLQTWIRARLRNRDVVFLGFWSDWAYLNEAFQSCITDSVENTLAVIVNRSSDDVLRDKAGHLWDWSQGAGITRCLVQESAADFLSELRKLFCVAFINRLLRASRESFLALGGSEEHSRVEIRADSVELDDAYRLRLDACGVPYKEVSRKKRPDPEMTMFGVVQLALFAKGATLDGSQFVLGNMRIRVVNGQGQLLSRLKSKYASEPAMPIDIHLTICVGATDDGGSTRNIVRGDGTEGTTVRAASPSNWQNETATEGLWRMQANVNSD